MTKYAMKAYIIFEADDEDDADEKALGIANSTDDDSFEYIRIESDTEAFELGNESAEAIFEARRIAEKMGWV